MKTSYSEKTTNIKSWAEDDRPREKLMLKGKSSLSDAELLAIIMGSGNGEETAVDLAKRILSKSENNWHELAQKSIKELCEFKGVGEAKAISIITALEIGRRRALQQALEKPIISSSQAAAGIMQPIIGDLPTEEFWVLYLNQSNKVLKYQKISSGGISQTLVDQRLVFKYALELNATALILSHNHPSGKLKPSEADLNLTQNIKKAGEIMNVQVLDHLIITQTAYLSLVDEGIF